MLTTEIALKEWAVVVEALASGRQLLLVRKGGIRDERGTFQLQHREFLLYPTAEHQGEEWIRPECLGDLKKAFRPPRGDQIVFKAYAGVAYTVPLQDPRILERLAEYHIWRPEFFEVRMQYQPGKPTLVMALRVYRLAKPISHPVLPAYAGCKSWVKLQQAIPVEGAVPVVENRRFRQALQEISGCLDAGAVSR